MDGDRNRQITPVDTTALPHVMIYHEGRFNFLPVPGAMGISKDECVVVEKWTTTDGVELDLLRRMYTRTQAVIWTTLGMRMARDKDAQQKTATANKEKEVFGPEAFLVMPSIHRRAGDGTTTSVPAPVIRCTLWHDYSDHGALVVSTIGMDDRRVTDKRFNMTSRYETQAFGALEEAVEAQFGKVTRREPAEGTENMRDLVLKLRSPKP